jgi:hypothetical protein
MSDDEVRRLASNTVALRVRADVVIMWAKVLAYHYRDRKEFTPNSEVLESYRLYQDAVPEELLRSVARVHTEEEVATLQRVANEDRVGYSNTFHGADGDPTVEGPSGGVDAAAATQLDVPPPPQTNAAGRRGRIAYLVGSFT